MMMKKEEIKREKKKHMCVCLYIYIYMYITPRISICIGISRRFKIKTHTHLSTMCNPITRTLFVPWDHSLPFAHVHLSQEVCVHLSPLLENIFSNDLFDEAR
jgi:hypothetical protein